MNSRIAALCLGAAFAFLGGRPAFAEPLPFDALANTVTASATVESPAVAAAAADEPHHPDPAKMVEHLRARLELTDGQAQKMLALLTSADATRKAHREAFEQRIKALMTPEQQSRMAQLKQERMDRRKQFQEAIKSGQRPPAPPQRHGHDDGLNFTPQQKIQMATLHLQMKHTMMADHEQFLAQTSAILTPLQEEAFEHMQHHGRGHERGGWKRGPGGHGGFMGPHGPGGPAGPGGPGGPRAELDDMHDEMGDND